MSNHATLKKTFFREFSFINNLQQQQITNTLTVNINPSFALPMKGPIQEGATEFDVNISSKDYPELFKIMFHISFLFSFDEEYSFEDSKKLLEEIIPISYAYLSERLKIMTDALCMPPISLPLEYFSSY